MAIRQLLQLRKGKWDVVGYGCMTCEKTYVHFNQLQKHMPTCIINTNNKKLKEELNMPIQRIVQNGEVYYRWGDHGKLYKDRADAEKQAQAAYASGYKENKPMTNKQGNK